MVRRLIEGSRESQKRLKRDSKRTQKRHKTNSVRHRYLKWLKSSHFQLFDYFKYPIGAMSHLNPLGVRQISLLMLLDFIQQCTGYCSSGALQSVALFIRGERGHNRTVGMHKKFWVIAWLGPAWWVGEASKVDDLTKVQLSLTNCPARGNWKKK